MTATTITTNWHNQLDCWGGSVGAVLGAGAPASAKAFWRRMPYRPNATTSATCSCVCRDTWQTFWQQQCQHIVDECMYTCMHVVCAIDIPRIRPWIALSLTGIQSASFTLASSSFINFLKITISCINWVMKWMHKMDEIVTMIFNPCVHN